MANFGSVVPLDERIFSAVIGRDKFVSRKQFFFASILVYAIFVGAWVLRRSRELVREMPMTCDHSTREIFAAAMIGVSPRMLKFLLVGALLAGTMHNMLILGTADLGQLWESSSDMGTAIGVWFVWLTMTTVVTSFIANGERFAEIGRDYLEVDLLEPDHMQLVGRAAMMPTLGIIGTQSFYPLLWIGGNNDLAAALPGRVLIFDTDVVCSPNE